MKLVGRVFHTHKLCNADIMFNIAYKNMDGIVEHQGHDLSHAEGNSLATAMLPLHRIKKSENRALNSASSIKDYIANGGSVSGLKAEVALGNVILDEANTDILTRGSYLWVSDSELRIKRIFTRPLSAVVSIAK